MNALIQLINTVSRYLRQENIPHCLVGGLSVAIWGRPRATEDVDLLVDLTEDAVPAFHAYLEGHGVRMDRDKAVRAIREGKGFPLYDTWSIHWVDVKTPERPIDRETLERATTIDLAEEPVPIATPEDVILHKLLARRDQDIVDARSIVLRKETGLDLDYLANRVRTLGIAAQWDKVRPELV
jgi:hypothetical protein